MKWYLPLILALLVLSGCSGTGVEDRQGSTENPAETRNPVENADEPRPQAEARNPAENTEEPRNPVEQTEEPRNPVEQTEEPRNPVEVQIPADTPKMQEVEPVGDPVRVKELAWDSQSTDCTLWLPEDGQYVPFLALSGDYGGSVLLLRRDILPESRPFNSYSAYYEDSALDRWLREEYVSRLEAVRDRLRSAEIVITAEGGLGVSGEETTTITREAFLLSCAETGFESLSSGGAEGRALAYFQTAENRIARGADGVPASWWLRTPDSFYLSAAYGIGPDGSLGSGNAFNDNGVRPALCLDADAEAVPVRGIVDGEAVYALVP